MSGGLSRLDRFGVTNSAQETATFIDEDYKMREFSFVSPFGLMFLINSVIRNIN
jgi:hypothetical protein